MLAKVTGAQMILSQVLESRQGAPGLGAFVNSDSLILVLILI